MNKVNHCHADVNYRLQNGLFAMMKAPLLQLRGTGTVGHCQSATTEVAVTHHSAIRPAA